MSRILFLLVLLASLVGCSEPDITQAEFNEALDGIPADPETYELTVVSCVNDGQVLRYTWGLKNLTDERVTYSFDPYVLTLTGDEEKKGRKLVGESVGPGEYMQWDGRNGGGELLPVGDVECRFDVFHSVLGVLRGEE